MIKNYDFLKASSTNQAFWRSWAASFRSLRKVVNLNTPSTVDKFRRQLLDELLPQQCLFCSGVCQAAICRACEAQLPWNALACPRCALPQSHGSVCRTCLTQPPAYTAAWAPFTLAAPVQQQIHALKYRAEFAATRLLAALMAARLKSGSATVSIPDVLIPVPLHRWRLWRRGYNQSLEIARVLRRDAGLRLEAGWAQRIRRTRDQIGMDAAARRRNLKNAFRVDAAVAGLSVALLDDVMTTGATLNELARACRKAGAREVQVWALARVP